MNKELSKTLTTALVQFIDRERPEGTMCCSNYECEKLEKAFEGGTYDEVENFIKRKLSRLTEFEELLAGIICDWGDSEETKISNYVKKCAPKLLDLAKQEICKGCDANLRGYIKGQEDAEKRYNESVAYHLPIMPTPPSGWGCDGTHCTNPQMDCINCPRKSIGGMFSTQSGTSTLKAE